MRYDCLTCLLYNLHVKKILFTQKYATIKKIELNGALKLGQGKVIKWPTDMYKSTIIVLIHSAWLLSNEAYHKNLTQIQEKINEVT